jgi:DNA-binding NtrC family response regulator
MDLFRKRPTAFDLVVTDERMVGMNGTDLVRHIHRLQPEFRAIMVTGFSSTIDRDALRCIGVKEVVQKPLKTKDFAVTVRRVLDSTA